MGKKALVVGWGGAIMKVGKVELMRISKLVVYLVTLWLYQKFYAGSAPRLDYRFYWTRS